MRSRGLTSADAKAAVDKHGSVRKAAVVLGLPSSTVHDALRKARAVADKEPEPTPAPSALRQGWPATDSGPSPPPSVVDTEDTAARRMEQASQTGTEADPTMGMPPALKPGEEQGSPPTTKNLEDRQPDLNLIAALQRYVNLTSNDVAHHVAVEAAQRISPTFTISTDHHRRIRNALGKGDEPVRLSEKPRRQVAGNKGVMVALIPPAVVAGQLATLGDEPVDEIHMTLAYLGKSDEYEPAQLDELRAVLARFAWSERPISCQASGTGRFRAGGDDADAWYCSVDAPALPGMRERMVQALWVAGFYPSQLHGFSPHMTMQFLKPDAPTPDDGDPPTPAWVCEALTLAVDEDWDDFPFRMRMAEQLDFATIAPPSYVQDTYARWEMTPSQAHALAQEITDTRIQAYTAGINDQLATLGRAQISGSFQSSILNSIEQESRTSAAGIMATYNRDLGSEVYTQYIEKRGTLGRQTSEYKLDQATQTWIDNRADWKAEQIASSEFGASYNDGIRDFVMHNGGVEMGEIQPDDAQCLICQDLVAEGSSPIEELLNLDLPVHPNCDHYVSPIWEDGALSDTQDPWVGQPDPEVSAAVTDLLASASAVEGAVTADLQGIATSLDAEMAGLDFRLKGSDSLTRKLEGIIDSRGLDPAAAAASISDALRYTMVAEADQLAVVTQQAVDDLVAKGYTLGDKGIKNYWVDGNTYKGVNVNLLKGGQKFELQFHTPESLALKEGQLHALYEEWRVLSPTSARYDELLGLMRSASAELSTPANIGAIGTLISG